MYGKAVKMDSDNETILRRVKPHENPECACDACEAWEDAQGVRLPELLKLIHTEWLDFYEEMGDQWRQHSGS